MCTGHHNTVIPELNDAIEREGEWVGFPVHSQTAVVGSQFSKHLQQSGGETAPRQTVDVLSVVYRVDRNTEGEGKHTHMSLCPSSLSSRWPQRQSRWMPVNPITLCALLPKGAFSFSSRSLKIHSAKACQLSVLEPGSNTDLITHICRNTYVPRSVCRDYINRTSTNVHSLDSVAAICLSTSTGPCVWLSGLWCTLRNPFRKQCWGRCGEEPVNFFHSM